MKKFESEYKKNYGDVSRDEITRFSNLLDSMNMSKKSREFIFPEIHRIMNIKWESIDFIIYLEPRATPRPRLGGGRVFYVSGAKENKDIFKRSFKNFDLPMIVTPCKFYVTSYLPIPKSMSKPEMILSELGLIRPITKPDWDNLGKTYSDMIQGTLLFDDSLIIDGYSRKFYSTLPRIEIHIEYMEEYDCLYNKKKLRKKVGLDG